ncbi:hydrogenase 2 accessory protein HypG [Aggregatibacter aphrophilus]|nr:hydrogenase 2 accessory protein HypG [Aggregatibacter aphrophilus]
MCLGVSGQIVKIGDSALQLATVDVCGVLLLAQASFACAFLISTNIYFQHKRGRLRYHIKILTDSARLPTRASPLICIRHTSGDARHQCIIDNI